MSTASKIEWTDTSWNPTSGCTRVSAGCDNCYAVAMSYRLENMWRGRSGSSASKYVGLTVLNPRGERHFNGTVRCHEDTLTAPLRWKRPRRVFVNSMSDLFHPDVPFEFVDRVFAVMASTPQHTYQVLTKRPERMASYLLDEFLAQRIHEAVKRRMGYDNPARPAINSSDLPLPNVWLGTSVEDQAAADERIPHLLACPAAVRFLSCEPLLGDIDLDRYLWTDDGAVDASVTWVIVGGESGRGARHCDIEWIRNILCACRNADVPVFVKQLGAKPGAWSERQSFGGPSRMEFERFVQIKDAKGGDPSEWPAELRVREFPR